MLDEMAVGTYGHAPSVCSPTSKSFVNVLDGVDFGVVTLVITS